MPQYRIKVPGLAKTYVFTGDTPPTEQEIAQAVLMDPTRKPASAEDFTPPSDTPAQTFGRVGSEFLSTINPMRAIEALSNLYHDPFGTARQVGEQQLNQAALAVQDVAQGRSSEAGGRAMAAMLPVVGPMAAEKADQIASGDVAGGIGGGLGLVAPALLEAGVKGGARAVGVVPQTLRTTAADALEAGAAQRVADVMTPKGGPNKARFAGLAQKAAPDLLEAGAVGGVSRAGLQARVGTRLADAQTALDNAFFDRLIARTNDTQPLLDALQAKRDALTAQAVEASKATPTTVSKTSPVVDKTGQPIVTTSQQARPFGTDVVPAPNDPRVAQIDQAIADIKQLGPDAQYESLRRIRQAYDQVAKVKYAPSMTQDYLAKQGQASGAADVTGVMRDFLAKAEPDTAAANASYSLYKTAQDVLSAAAEVEQTRPKVGRQIAARWLGATTGAQAAGLPGAVGGYVLGPLIDAALTSGVTTKLQTARLMSQLAGAIRAADATSVSSILTKLKALTGVSIGTGTATSPSESPTAPGAIPVAPGKQ